MASTDIPFRATDLVTTPCVGVCRIDPQDGLCAGCARSLDEIARWGAMSDAERTAIMEALAGRRPHSRKGGRRARLATLCRDAGTRPNPD